MRRIYRRETGTGSHFSCGHRIAGGIHGKAANGIAGSPHECRIQHGRARGVELDDVRFTGSLVRLYIIHGGYPCCRSANVDVALRVCGHRGDGSILTREPGSVDQCRVDHQRARLVVAGQLEANLVAGPENVARFHASAHTGRFLIDHRHGHGQRPCRGFNTQVSTGFEREFSGTVKANGDAAGVGSRHYRKVVLEPALGAVPGHVYAVIHVVVSHPPECLLIANPARGVGTDQVVELSGQRILRLGFGIAPRTEEVHANLRRPV